MAKILSCLRKSTVRQAMIKASIPELLIVICLSNDKQRYAPITEDELAKGKASKTLRLPGQFETLGALKSGVSGIVTYNRDLDYLNQLPQLLDEPSLMDVQEMTQTYIKPDQWTWLIVGDLDKIEEPIRNLNLGTVKVIN